MAHEVRQQVVLTVGEADLAARAAETLPGGVEDQRVGQWDDAEAFPMATQRMAAQDRPYAGQHFIVVDRLEDAVICSGVERADALGGGVLAGQ
jgi:hypothetical protein